MLHCNISGLDAAVTLSQALQSLLSLGLFRSRPTQAVADQDPSATIPDDGALTGATFAAQEPALSQELHLTGQDISGWAMGGSSLSD